MVSGILSINLTDYYLIYLLPPTASPQEVLYRNRSLKHVYLDSVDAPGGFGNWGYDVASYGTKTAPSDVKASMEASVQLVEAKIKEIVGVFHEGHGGWLLVVGCWLLGGVGSGCCLLVVGCWVVGGWLLGGV